LDIREKILEDIIRQIENKPPRFTVNPESRPSSAPAKPIATEHRGCPFTPLLRERVAGGRVRENARNR